MEHHSNLVPWQLLAARTGCVLRHVGLTGSGELVVADEISPDTCRLWDLQVADAQDRILDKDRFRQDLGGVVEAYGEVLKRVQGACPNPRLGK